mmetsp:Transcript_11963/g.17698  ORF Transcript_11963/g.17698 Transcript_11963/m.17698 type:complete len:238 (-) Transcript_11963:395-1108(-)
MSISAEESGREDTEHESYEDYLDEQITTTDMHYLQDRGMARQIYELEYHKWGGMSREEFEQAKKDKETRPCNEDDCEHVKKSRTDTKNIRDFSEDSVLLSMAEREDMIRKGVSTPIIFLRSINANGHEVSAYIDVTQRMKEANFDQYFTKKKRFLPKHGDLSYYNWQTGVHVNTHSAHFEVISSSDRLFFKSKVNGKVISVDPRVDASENVNGKELISHDESHAVIFDFRVNEVIPS